MRLEYLSPGSSNSIKNMTAVTFATPQTLDKWSPHSVTPTGRLIAKGDEYNRHHTPPQPQQLNRLSLFDLKATGGFPSPTTNQLRTINLSRKHLPIPKIWQCLGTIYRTNLYDRHVLSCSGNRRGHFLNLLVTLIATLDSLDALDNHGNML